MRRDHDPAVEPAARIENRTPEQRQGSGTETVPARPDVSSPAADARGALVAALFAGLSPDDQAWVIDRIRHYRALAAADQASEGRL